MYIDICGSCKGSGEIEENVGTHHSEYESKTCINCNGTGRLKIKVYQLIIPFNIDDKKIYKLDSEISTLIKNGIKEIKEK